jgi:hypothetical protein
MVIHGKALTLITLTLTILLAAPVWAENTANLTACTTVTLGNQPFNYDGATLLALVRAASGRTGGDAPNAPDPISPLAQTAKPNGKKCAGAMEARLKTAPDLSQATAPKPGSTNGEQIGSAYYGAVASPAKFRALSELKCSDDVAGRTKPWYSNQFFSIGDMIFYRYCGGGDGTGYVYFWGMDGTSSTCVASSYPAMYAAMDPKLTLDALRQAEKNANVGTQNAAGQALGNAVAALLVAEAHRDYNLKYLNYMLPGIEDSAVPSGANKDRTATSAILAGYCPPNVGNGCQNPDKQGMGVHPLAWGGAQARMMTGGAWGHAAGATSDFGRNYEAGLIQRWLAASKNGTPAKAGTVCTLGVGAPIPGQDAFVKLMNTTFYK